MDTTLQNDYVQAPTQFSTQIVATTRNNQSWVSVNSSKNTTQVSFSEYKAEVTPDPTPLERVEQPKKELKLPKIKTAGSNLIQGQLVVGIKSSGEYELNGNASNVTEIQTIMESIAVAQKDTQILIAADEDVPLKFLTAIVDLCRQSGLENFRLQSR